ncbi:MAG: NAD-dependent epimerase, partial [Xanthobacteraceae bacterium]
MTPILVSGAAGFIGFQLSRRYLEAGRPVVGFDNLNDYYDVSLKQARLDVLQRNPAFQFVHADLADAAALNRLFEQHKFEVVVNLAAQAGVRYSLTNPQAYVASNIVGFVNILEACRHHGARHLLYASSSSVYGGVTKMPFSVHQNVDHPLSVYAATKKSNELLAHTYSHLFRLPTTGLRFFTVYGPWGRPDMALFIFTRAILAGRPIQIFNHGRMERDFTYIDDIVDGVFRLTDRLPQPDVNWNGDAPDPGRSSAPYRLYNIGNSRPVPLMRLIAVLEKCLGVEAKKEFLPMQPGDVPATYADIDDLNHEIGFHPQTSIETGVA